MAGLASYRDDTAGAIASGGTSTAYTVASYSSFDTRPHMAGQIIAFTPHTTNGATVTLNVDGLGALPLRTAPSTELGAGVLVQGTPYVALYNNSTTEFLLQGFYSNPFNVPLGTLLDYTGTTAPNSNFVLAYGQAISRTTYAAYFAIVSTTYGVGDGVSTFNVIDVRGRVIAGKDDMGGSAASRLTSTYFGASAATIGATGGLESNTLTVGGIPAHSHGVTDPGHVHQVIRNALYGGGGSHTMDGSAPGADTQPTNSNTTGISINNAGGGAAHANVQPTIVASKILRVF